IKEALEGKDAADAVIHINSRDISKLYANRKEFFNEMKEQLNIKKLKVAACDELVRGELVIETDGSKTKLSLKEYMFRKYKLMHSKR
ncbi:MAG: bioB/LipA-like protein, partial [Firmicutes bacterium]|nr:bioB/LipA-like protein [Bacillota bacterium]